MLEMRNYVLIQGCAELIAAWDQEWAKKNRDWVESVEVTIHGFYGDLVLRLPFLAYFILFRH